MYWRITSTGAPPAVSRQKLWLQKASFLLFLKLDCQWLFFDISLPWSDDNTLDILNAHYDLFFPCKSVLFLTIYVFDWLYYTTDRTTKQMFFLFFVQFISHLQRKENSCYIMSKILYIPVSSRVHFYIPKSRCLIQVSCISPQIIIISQTFLIHTEDIMISHIESCQCHI